MANLPHKMPGKALFVYSMCLLSHIPIIKADPTFRSIDCNSTVPTDQALCPGVTTDVCRDCIDYAKRDAAVRCPGSKPFSIVYDECTVRNSTVSAPTIKGADPTFAYINCPNTTLTTTGTYAPNSTYKTNLDSLLSVLSSNSNNALDGFYNYTAGTSAPDVVYGLFLCRGDLTVAACRECVTYASRDVVQQCPGAKRVIIWYDECMLRYSNESIFATQETMEWVVLIKMEWVVLINTQNVSNTTHYSEVLGEVL
ncbi:putative cysteine-rich receptor-like protein kinase 23 [Rhododendron vialii]|uniref:putative cysteine-rich receptor-like protein kinase 23 n=1 Tax=Rhododendron vialii TaxID=182163 RepID=UPI00265E93C9|nr:putative cysteine-rich receptor-like protein kinase 23 [Rhododendron vialii]